MNNKIEHRADIYKLLSVCFQTPNENLSGYLSELRKSVRIAYPDIFENLSPKLTASEDVEELKLEHTRLFIGPFKLLVPPYGSMYLESEGQLMTNSTMDLLRRFREENIDVAIQEIPDHITIELEYMYLLIYKEMKADELNQSKLQKNGTGSKLGHHEVPESEKSPEELVFDYRFKQYDFLNKHLSKWIPEFKEKVDEHAKLNTYKYLAFITDGVIKSDLKTLKQLLSFSDK